jgi:hypothetical protein
MHLVITCDLNLCLHELHFNIFFERVSRIVVSSPNINQVVIAKVPIISQLGRSPVDQDNECK